MNIEQGIIQKNTGPLSNPSVLEGYHDPKTLHAAVKSLGTQTRNTDSLTHTQKIGERPLYGEVETPNELQIIAQYGVYDLLNKMIDKDGRYRGIDTREMMPVREKIWELTQTEGVSVLLPFHEEQGSVGKNMKTAREWVGQNRTYGISTGKDKEAKNEAHNAGGYVLEQGEIFTAVQFNWDVLRENAGIDLKNIGTNKPLAGSKGITILAGTILATALAESGEINKKQIMVWHDTDIINPEEYSAIPLTLWPYAQEDPELSEVYMSMIARNGVGRNNEAVTFITNRLSNSRNSLIKKFGNMMSSTVWPLTGERALRLDRLRDMSIASGMGLETLTNANMAGVCATEKKGHIAQVLNPMPKNEKGTSKPVREFTVISNAANMLMDIAQHIEYTGKLPNQWNIEDIKDYNLQYGGRSLNLLLQADTLAAQEPVTIQTDYIIPPVDTLLHLGIVTLP